MIRTPKEIDHRSKSYTRSLPCALTDEEVRVKGVQLAETHDRIEEKELEKKVVVADFATALAKLKVEGKKLGTEIQEEIEHRGISCHTQYDIDKWYAQIIREDTGEVIDARPMTQTERDKFEQVQLFAVEGRDEEDQKESVSGAADGAEKEVNDVENAGS